MLHQNPAQNGQIINVPPEQTAIPLIVSIPLDVFEKIDTVAHDNGQTFEQTVLAALDKIFVTCPLYITVPPNNLNYMYLNTGKTVADVVGSVKSARLEVIR